MQVIPAGSAIIAVTFGLARYAYGLFLPVIRADFRLSTEAIGVIASGQAAAYLLATVVASVIAARVEPRLPVVVGGLSATAGMLLIATAHTVWLLAAGVVVAGASAGWAYPPLSDAVARLVRTNGQSQAVSAISAGTSYGVIVAGPIALWAGPHWRLAWLVFAALAVVATLWNARLLPLARSSGAAVLGSAVLFGGLYILVTGLLGVWTMNVFYRRPSAGLGATSSLLAAGQLVGPALMGLLADRVGLAVPFYLAGGLMAALALIGPRIDIRSAVPRPPG